MCVHACASSACMHAKLHACVIPGFLPAEQTKKRKGGKEKICSWYGKKTHIPPNKQNNKQTQDDQLTLWAVSNSTQWSANGPLASMNLTFAPFRPLERRAVTGLILVTGVDVTLVLLMCGVEGGRLLDRSTLWVKVNWSEIYTACCCQWYLTMYLQVISFCT